MSNTPLHPENEAETSSLGSRPSVRHSVIRFGLIILALGFVSGVIGGFFKLGWEVLAPPRTVDRIVPPKILLHNIGNSVGIPLDSWVVHYSGIEFNLAPLIIHFGFSVVVAIVYAFYSIKFSDFSLRNAAFWGFAIWVVFHLVALPILGLTPAPWHLPFDEHLSEFFGHIIWLVVIEIVIHDLWIRIKPPGN